MISCHTIYGGLNLQYSSGRRISYISLRKQDVFILKADKNIFKTACPKSSETQHQTALFPPSPQSFP